MAGIILPASVALRPQRGLLANRPPAVGSFLRYTATDVNGGTEYEDTAAGVWSQVAAPVTYPGKVLCESFVTTDMNLTPGASFADLSSMPTMTIPANVGFFLAIIGGWTFAKGSAAADASVQMQVRIADSATGTNVLLGDFFGPDQIGASANQTASFHTASETKAALGAPLTVKLQGAVNVVTGLGTAKLFADFGKRPIVMRALAA